MVSKVALIESTGEITTTFHEAINLIGGIDELNSSDRNVVVKVGVFNPKQGLHTTIPVTQAIIHSFQKAPNVYLAESDNYRGTGTERLQIWQELFSDRVVPFNLTEDTDTQSVTIAEEEMALSHILFRPNVLVSTHALRRYKQGTVLKNLLGLAPMRKKARFHKNLVTVLLDLFEAVGGIDLAVADATYTFPGPGARKKALTNLIILGRDAVAVDAVGAKLVGLDPSKMPIIKEAEKRGLGEGTLKNIDVVGSSLAIQSQRVTQLLKMLKKKK